MSETRPIRFPARPDSVRRARDAALAAVPGGLSPRTAAELRLLVSELVTNAVMHGRSTHFEIEVARYDAHLRVEVTDAGAGPTTPAMREPSTDGTGGLGLHVVDSIALRWGAENGPPTRVWFELAVAA